MNITDVCLKKPVFAWMIMLATITFGLVAVTRIGISQFPDVDYPTISVSMSWAGASPEDIETGVVNPLEEVLAQVEGIQSITSKSSQNSARITATFDMSRNIDLALQDTQAKIASAQRSLPKDVDPPTVSKSNPDDQPIITIGLSGPFSRQLLADVARYQLMERLQTVPGVGQVTMSGYVDRNIRIWIDANRLTATSITVSDITSALTREHVTAPGGQFDAQGRQVSIRVLGEAADLDTLKQIIVKVVDNAPIRLQDVALVEDGFQDVTSLARSNGSPVQGLGILKQRGTNAVAVATDIRAALDDVQKTLPEGMELNIVFDTTQFISESVQEIEIELGLALILTALVCWLFLGSLSSTMNVVLAIPMSLLGTIAVLYFLHFTLNTFTLLGLSLAVGLVVDDAVMVMENIFRHAEMGKDKVRAASEGTKEITFAALAATLAVIAIFLPVVFMSGVVGKFFFQFGITLSVAVALSYVEAITLAPARCAQLVNTGHQQRGIIGRNVDRAFAWLERTYGWALGKCLRRPWIMLIVGLAVMGVSGWVAKGLPGEFVPSQDQSRLALRLTMATGSNLDESDRLVKRVEAWLAARPEVERTMVNVGMGNGSVSITMVPPSQRKLTQMQFADAMRKEFSQYAGMRASVQDLSQQGFTGQSGKPLEFSVRGSDWDTLIKLSETLKEKIIQSGLSADADSDYQVGLPELQIVPDRGRASDVGITVQDVATTVNALVGGVVVGKYSSAGRRLDVRMRLLEAQRTRPEDIGKIHLRAANGDMVPLSSLVKQQEMPVMQSISHADRERAITITGNIATGHAQAEVLTYVQSLQSEVPAGYRLVLGGQSSSFSDSMGSLVFALILGIGVAYMVLASQFNSFLHPVTVLSILPLSVAGAVWGLLIAGKTINVFSMIGVLLLMGIVKKNSIILVDYALLMREEGLDARGAMQKAGPVRLRPILMTSVATLMSAIPSAMGFGPGAETRAPMADAVIGGLVLSTGLSLLVVPCFYVVADDIKSWLGRLRGTKVEAPAHVPTPAAHP